MPVMVTTTVSAVGEETSMLPPPVWLQPERWGVTWPCRSRMFQVTVGVGAVPGVTVIVTGVPGGIVLVSWAAMAGSGSSTTNMPAMSRFMIALPPKALRAVCLLAAVLPQKSARNQSILSAENRTGTFPPPLPPQDHAGAGGQQPVVALEG